MRIFKLLFNKWFPPLEEAHKKLLMRLDAKRYLPTLPDKDTAGVAFTIVAKNYIHHALTLREAFLRNNPDHGFIVVLMDMAEKREDIELLKMLASKKVEIMCFNEIRNEIHNTDLENMLFKYNVLEMVGAIKPFVFEYLLKKGHEKIVYLDSDIYIFNSLKKLFHLLEKQDIVLTPHILGPYKDEKHPSEKEILNAGTYNLGFIAIRNSANTLNFCKWWQHKLYDGCFVDIPKGMLADQKWIDLAPSLFEKVFILKDRGYNAAYWNLHERKIYRKKGTWYANMDKLVFFHFSGLLPDNYEAVSKYQDRHVLSSFPAIRTLFRKYIKELNNNGMKALEGKSYYFNKVPATNIMIPDVLRKRFYTDILKEVPNPFKADKDNIRQLICSFTKDIFGDGSVNRVGYSLWNSIEALKKKFPDLDDKNTRKKYRDWFVSHARQEYGINDSLCKVGSDIRRKNIFKEDAVGLNILGCFTGMFGIADDVRSFAKKAYKSGIPYTLFNIETKTQPSLELEEIEEYKKYYSGNPAFKKNLICVSANVVSQTCKMYPSLFKSKHNAAVLVWEFDDYFYFSDMFKYIDEAIVYTDFVRTAVRKAVPKGFRITKMRYPFIKDWAMNESSDVTRRKLGLKQDDFVFMFSFDFFSCCERKNPGAIIEAFSKAFPNKKDVKLILKVSHSKAYWHPRIGKITEQLNQLILLIDKYRLRDSVIIIEEPLSMNDFMALINISDCYISLHRGEGFGLGMFRAMFCGKPVIATKYSGNMEFMNPGNSLLVDYKKTEISQNLGVYRKGWSWADPNTDMAAAHMLKLYNDRNFAARLGEKAKQSIQDYCSPNVFTEELYDLILRD